VPLGSRADLRGVPLVTIDGADARDFDDAVFAEADTDPANPEGWHLIVAIADVAHYVHPGDALDQAANQRGNSVYFPDRVVPMLPEQLSNDLCSLRPHEERACVAVHIWVDRDGNKLSHRFVRGLMRSAARLTYEQVQRAHDGAPEVDGANPVPHRVIEPLYGAFRALARAREARGTLDLDLPERQVIVDPSGAVTAIVPRPRLDSHRLIEEFMILANVCAAETLEAAGQPCMYRVHDAPSAEKLEALRGFLDGLHIRFPKGQVVKPRNFMQVL
jgi:ribonuclease R